MRRDSSPTDRTENFTRRLRQTMDSELEPEQVTPNSAGSEELPEYDETMPIVKQFNQTNMHGRRGRQGNQSGRGKDQD